METTSLFAGLSMVVMHLGARAAKEDIDIVHKNIMNDNIARKLFWVAVVYVATRDAAASVLLGFAMAVVTEIFNHQKPLFVLRYNIDKASRYFISKNQDRR
jgi:hypothetical protein